MTDSHSPASKRTIMVVDDHPALVEILRIRLEANGFNVRCAYSGKDLFAGLEEQKPDLILLDVMMPQMDGLEMLRRLKGAPENSSIPIIMLTAMAKDWEAAHKLGADHYITKPYTAPQLLTGINSLLSRGKAIQ